MSQASISDIPTTSTADQEVLVKVEGVSKKFCRSLKKSLWYGVCDIAGELSPFGRRDIAGDRRLEMADRTPSSISQLPSTSPPLRDGEFWAVNDVSFELRRGECLGLIGHNGAGKTTLLKMLNGLIKPDSGKITMRGRVGALIALGAGFNPILTGRENIYINGSVLGLSKKEIDEKIDEIIDFAEIGEFIDSPVQNYSSGMTVRLGFAVATALDPDILILDEVLAVGDVDFRRKCYDRISRLRKKAAVVFVSHNADQLIQVCSRGVVLNTGRMMADESIEKAIACYSELAKPLVNSAGSLASDKQSNLRIECPQSFGFGETLAIFIDYSSERKVEICDVKIQIRDAIGSTIAEFYTRTRGLALRLERGANRIRIDLGPMHLKKGNYHLALALLDRDTNEHLYWSEQIQLLLAVNELTTGGAYQLPGGLVKL
jgi:lipopolysaccharide transport system ATP-binding protein